MLEVDAEHWERDLEVKEREAVVVTQKLRKLYLEQRPFEPVRYSIKRLALWGEQVEDQTSEIDSPQINFQWPTQAMLNDMPEDVSLSTLTFKYNKDSLPLVSVSCTL